MILSEALYLFGRTSERGATVMPAGGFTYRTLFLQRLLYCTAEKTACSMLCAIVGLRKRKRAACRQPCTVWNTMMCSRSPGAVCSLQQEPKQSAPAISSHWTYVEISPLERPPAVAFLKPSRRLETGVSRSFVNVLAS